MSQSMVGFFDVLPKDILLEILEYLDAKSLKNCIEASKRCAEIIGDSSNCMKKLPLYLCLNNLKDPEDLKVLTRRYQHLICDGIVFTDTIVNKMIKANTLESLRIIEFIDCGIEANAIPMLLEATKSLEKLSIIESTVHSFKKRNLIDVPTLKSIIFMESELVFLEFLGRTKTCEFKIHHSNFKEKDTEILEEFLMRTSSLQDVGIRVKQGIIYKCLTNDDSKEYSFKLRKFAVTYGYFDMDDEVDESFLDILKQHQETLENMEIDCKLTEEAYEHILSKMKLKTLRIDARHLPSAPLFYTAIAPNNHHHLQKLVITSEFNGSFEATGLLRINKNIKDLIIMDWTSETSNDILIFIASNFNRLQCLSIPDLPDSPPEVPIFTLKTLHIESMRAADDFQAYVSVHPNIKKLTVKWVNEELSDQALNAITTNLKQLEQLAFGPTFDLSFRQIDMMKENAPNLHKIELFRFIDDINNTLIRPKSLPRIFYYSNASSKYIFKSEPEIWANEDSLYHFTRDDVGVNDDDSDQPSDDNMDWDGDEHDFDDEEDYDFEDEDQDYEFRDHNELTNYAMNDILERMFGPS